MALLLLHLQNRPLFPHLPHFEDLELSLHLTELPSDVLGHYVLSSWLLPGFFPYYDLAWAIVISKFLSPAAHIVMPLLLCFSLSVSLSLPPPPHTHTSMTFDSIVLLVLPRVNLYCL